MGMLIGVPTPLGYPPILLAGIYICIGTGIGVGICIATDPLPRPGNATGKDPETRGALGAPAP